MNKHFIGVVFGLAFMWLLVLAQPAAAFSGIQFDVKDSVTGDPWGSMDGQGYRIIIVDGSTVTYNSGNKVTPTDPPLLFTCDFGVACPSLGGAVIPTPTPGNNVKVIVTLDGTSADPTTITFDFDYFADYGVPYTFNGYTGTGPTAVTLQSTQTSSASTLPIAAASMATLLVLVTMMVIKRRQQSAALALG